MRCLDYSMLNRLFTKIKLKFFNNSFILLASSIMSTVVRQLKELPEKSYVATSPFNTDVYTYTVTQSPVTYQTTGALAANVTGATALTCPAGTVLRENGKKLYPGAHNGVTTLMVGVFWNTAKTDTTTSNMLSGFIDPNSPKFAVFSADRPNYMNVLPVDPTGGLPDQSAPTLTNGTVIASGQVRSSTLTALTTVDGTPNTAALDVSLGQVFTLTTTKAVTITLSNPSPGAQVFLIVTGGGSHTITPGTNIKGMGTLTVASGSIYTLHYISDGTSLLEVSRTAAFTDTT